MGKNIENKGDDKQKKVPPMIRKKGYTIIPPKNPINPTPPDERSENKNEKK